MFEDAPAGIEAPRAAHSRVVALATTYEAAEFSGADWIVADPAHGAAAASDDRGADHPAAPSAGGAADATAAAPSLAVGRAAEHGLAMARSAANVREGGRSAANGGRIVPGERLARVVSGYLAPLARGDVTGVGGILADGVTWTGPPPDQACSGRAAVLEVLGRAFGGAASGAALGLEALELREAGSRVLLSARGARFADPSDPAGRQGAAYQLIELGPDDRVVRILGFARRQAALAALGADEPGWP